MYAINAGKGMKKSSFLSKIDPVIIDGLLIVEDRTSNAGMDDNAKHLVVSLSDGYTLLFIIFRIRACAILSVVADHRSILFTSCYNIVCTPSLRDRVRTKIDCGHQFSIRGVQMPFAAFV